ncbi:MAG TPA: hypothetical protein VMR98_02880 [Candidatus Polarisedimenticolaceae bacterium]|nr:hypothetical protein [Candidatus Polarisedimenticolaceae bacterium]
MIQKIALRLLISMVLGFLIAIGINEFSFIFMKSEAGRGPERIEMVIPAGTADKLARGEEDPTLPDKMVFVQGDTLVVVNQDIVNHRLGPLFIPAGTSASLTLNQAANITYSCSFEPTQYFGLDVREPVSTATRLEGIFISALPLGVLFMLYSILVWPLTPKPAETT